MEHEQCSWCGEAIEPDAGFRAAEPAGERKAAFCRLEHVVPWVIQGAHWDPGTILEPGDPDEQAMPSGEDRGHDQLGRVFEADDAAFQPGADRIRRAGDSLSEVGVVALHDVSLLDRIGHPLSTRDGPETKSLRGDRP